ncbi:MAG: 6-pyruvoyl trahydropterin synthase family protein [Schleiferiaceae bacterium]|nr:MAG: 6-pyruvoyl tetrahydrobiopterin synthase [Owenweeksia sp. TMED14]|tara:strand:- start:47429 stop:47839 length:411 start_codon:yes stop_codon:yes gene_type:complete
MKATVSRHAHFNAAHRLHIRDWSDKKNQEFFGLCNNNNFHGHNYELIVSIKGEIDPITGYVYDMKELSNIIKTKVEKRLDHKNLNLDVPAFKNLNPSAENIAMVIYNWLKPHFSSGIDLKIRLYETPRNYVDFGDD